MFIVLNTLAQFKNKIEVKPVLYAVTVGDN